MSLQSATIIPFPSRSAAVRRSKPATPGPAPVLAQMEAEVAALLDRAERWAHDNASPGKLRPLPVSVALMKLTTRLALLKLTVMCLRHGAFPEPGQQALALGQRAIDLAAAEPLCAGADPLALPVDLALLMTAADRWRETLAAAVDRARVQA